VYGPRRDRPPAQSLYQRFGHIVTGERHEQLPHLAVRQAAEENTFAKTFLAERSQQARKRVSIIQLGVPISSENEHPGIGRGAHLPHEQVEHQEGWGFRAVKILEEEQRSSL
jgi:hypothetical protein